MSDNEQLDKLFKKIQVSAGNLHHELRIITIDDEPNNFDTLQVIRDKLGIQIECFVSAQAAINHLKNYQRHILCIFCDLQMPDIDGVMACDQLRKLNITAPIAILTGFISKALAIKAIESKVSILLEKPLNLSEFVSFFERELLKRISDIKDEWELFVGFIDESRNNLTVAEDLVIEIEQDAHNKDAVNKLFGIIHTIKGSSGFFHPKTISQFAHKFEEQLKLVQKNEIAFDPVFASKTLQSIDWLKKLVNEMANGEEHSHGPQEIFDSIFVKSKEIALENHEISEVQNSHKSKATSAKDIKVEGKVLDEFVRLSGEMTVIRNMINKSLRNVAKSHQGDKDVENLIELLDELHKINSNIQHKVSDLRRVSFKNVVRPMGRAVRETSKLLGKDVDLKIIGEEVRLDTTLADVLNNCLIHLVRNSVDHGIEKPEKRQSANKRPTGTITLSAQQKDDLVVIEIVDDGAGINTAAIKNRLLQNGLHTQEKINAMSEEEIHLQIFAPGFSTAEKVSDISGRGVGMSMVKSSVEEIGGQLRIQSVPGVGSTFTLTLPVPKSVLITNCVFFFLGQKIYGIPQDNVHRILGPETSIEKLHNIQTLRFGENLFEIMDLNVIFNSSDSQNICQGPYIIIQAQGAYCAFQVKEVMEIEDTVIKIFPSGLNKHGLFKGTTFLSDGKVGLIISADGLISHLGLKAKKLFDKKIQAVNVEAPRPKNLLCFRLSALAGIYAISQECVFRIEEVKQSQIKQSGNNFVVPYRDSLIHLFDLEILFSNNHAINFDSAKAENADIKIFVIYHQQHFIGLPFKEITDVHEYHGEIKSDVNGRFGVIGSVEINDQAVTILDPIKFSEKVMRSHPTQKVIKMSA